jgi:hypothetical protein
MKIISILFAMLFPALSQANTMIQYNSTVGNQTAVIVNYCQPGTTNWVGFAGGNPLGLTANQQLNIESVCQMPVIGSSYKVIILSQAAISQSCLHTNGVGVLTQSNPNSSPALNGSFYGNGTGCGTPCG